MPAPEQPLEPEFTPRWTWRSVGLATAITLALYVILPYLERLSAPSQPTFSIRPVNTVELPPPPPPPEPPQRKPAEPESKPPQPKMEEVRRRLTPLQAALNLSLALGDVGGDFNVHFGAAAPQLTQQIRDLIFELSELDEPPRPLARLQPLYPPQARMRRVTGLVVVEFVVASDGTARDIQVVSSEPGDVFTEAAVRAIERWRFSPGTKDGKPVAARVIQKVTFRLK
jgi:protein TonB